MTRGCTDGRPWRIVHRRSLDWGRIGPVGGCLRPGWVLFAIVAWTFPNLRVARSRPDCSILWMGFGRQRLDGLLGDVCWRIDLNYSARAKG
jgi:hypothetical protein